MKKIKDLIQSGVTRIKVIRCATDDNYAKQFIGKKGTVVGRKIYEDEMSMYRVQMDCRMNAVHLWRDEFDVIGDL